MPRKFWMVYCTVNTGKLSEFDNYEDAADEARRKATSGDTYALAPVAFVKQPVPNLPIEKVALGKLSSE